MSAEQLLYALTGIRGDFIREALPAGAPRRRRRPWAAIAACLCLVLLMARAHPAAPADRELPAPEGGPAADSGESPDAGCDFAPRLTVDGVTYVASGHFTPSPERPEGFACAGEAAVTHHDGPLPYYTSPERPEWVYVYQECYNQQTQEFYMGYARYVEEGLWNLGHLLRYQGELYISLMNLYSLSLRDGADPEEQTRYDALPYGRILQDLPEGFAPVGRTVFDGYDLVPASELGSNFLPGQQVLANPAEPDILLLRWYQNGLSGPEYWVFVRYQD